MTFMQQVNLHAQSVHRGGENRGMSTIPMATIMSVPPADSGISRENMLIGIGIHRLCSADILCHMGGGQAGAKDPMG